MSSRFLPLLLAAACTGPVTSDAPDETGDTGETVDPLSWDPAAPGPYGVGYRELSATYATFDGDRTIPIAVWFPTDATSGTSVDYAGVVPARENVLGDVDPAASPWPDGTWPVAVHSHGDRSHGGSHEGVARRMVTHGWVVAAPFHVLNQIFDDVEPDPQDQWFTRPTDVSAALDAIDALPAGDPLATADTSRVLVSGHSRGVSTAWTILGASFDGDPSSWCPDCTDDEKARFASLDDDRAVGAVFLAGGGRGGLFGDTGTDAVTKPHMAMLGTGDNGYDGQLAFWADRADTTPVVAVTDACHDSFAIGICNDVDVEATFDLIGTWLLSAARVWVLGDDDARTSGRLDGTTPVDDGMTRVAFEDDTGT